MPKTTTVSGEKTVKLKTENWQLTNDENFLAVNNIMENGT